jgi:AcrR family transcriptional regulator
VIPLPPTRDLLLDAAMREFSRRGYAATSVRRVAREAGVNARLLFYYFGSKEALFEECVDRLSLGNLDLHPPLDDDRRMGHRLTERFITTCDRDGGRQDVLLLVQAALAAETHGRARIGRRLVSEVVEPLACVLDGEARVERAEAAIACLIGVGMCRYVLGVAPLAQRPVADVVALVGPVVDAVLEAPGAVPSDC